MHQIIAYNCLENVQMSLNDTLKIVEMLRERPNTEQNGPSRIDLFPNGAVQFGLGNILPIPPLYYLPYLPYTTSPTPSYPIPPHPVPDHHPCLSASRIELSRKDWSIRIEMLRPNIVQFALAYPNCPIIKLPQPIRSRQSGLTMLLSVMG